MVLKLALRSVTVAKERFPGYRLARLVAARLNLDESDMAMLPDVLRIDIVRPYAAVSRPFNDHLRFTIRSYGLEQLFNDDGPAPYHHAIRPVGYDFARDAVIPLEMERWRADYRAMTEEQQMLAASIVWLYRAGRDSVWLRRVPCTWHAADAIERLRRESALADWAALFALYPGW